MSLNIEDPLVSAFVDQLLRWNARVPLVSRLLSRKQIERMLVVPILHAVQETGSISGRLMDFGAGSGMGGILFALANPGLVITFVERVHKKAIFIKQACRGLGIGDRVLIVDRDYRDARREVDAYDFFFARAVGGIEEVIMEIRTVLSPEARILLLQPVGCRMPGICELLKETEAGAGLLYRQLRLGCSTWNTSARSH